MNKSIDWTDVKYAVFVGVIAVLVKAGGDYHPDWLVSRYTTDAVGSIFTIGYVIARARRQPEKLDEWGITTPLTAPSLLAGVGLALAALGSLAGMSLWAGGKPSFEAAYFFQGAEYIVSAFSQQFFLCSVGLVSLSKLQVFQGNWRLPLTIALLFSLAHFWTPARVPGTIVPIQMLLTFPMGFCAAFYFLKFRSILPLMLIHAFIYPLVVHWVENLI